MSLRFSALTILQQCILQQQSLANRFIKQEPYCQTLVYGVCRYFWQLDAIAQSLLRKPLKDKDSDIYFLVLIGLFELLHSQTAEHAIIDECVKVCDECKKTWAKNMVNAVLRHCSRDKDKALSCIGQSAAATYSHPNWIIKMIEQDWPQQAQQILSANNQQAPMHLRINQQQTTLTDYLQQCKQQSIAAQRHPIAGISLQQPCAVSQLPHFKQGYCSVQDPSAQLATLILDPQDHERILDACAAPGGKTCHILESTTECDCVALEINKQRAEKIVDNVERLQKQVTIMIADAADIDSWWDDKCFDRILCDAPCSASGVIRRHPDIKHLRKKKDIAALAAQQLQLLSALWTTLKTQGRCLYCTCSVFKNENDAVITNFLAKHSNAKVLPLSLTVGRATDHGWQILPGEEDMDGFYYCLLEKTE